MVIVIALVLSFLIKTFIVQTYWISSPSMEGTLQVQDRVLATKWRPGLLEMRRGDIVVFEDPGGWLPPATPPANAFKRTLKTSLQFVGLLPQGDQGYLVKRVIGLPGETVSCASASDQVHINGEPLVEDYLYPGSMPCGIEFSVTIPEGYIWVMGDNRNNSTDSRAKLGDPGGGAVPVKGVSGTVFVTIWPFGHWGGHGNPFAE